MVEANNGIIIEAGIADLESDLFAYEREYGMRSAEFMSRLGIAGDPVQSFAAAGDWRLLYEQIQDMRWGPSWTERIPDPQNGLEEGGLERAPLHLIWRLKQSIPISMSKN